MDRRQTERAALDLVAYEIVHGNKASVLNAFLCTHVQKFGLDARHIISAHYNIVWDGVLLSVQNTVLDLVVFLYGPDGMQEPTFYNYNPLRKHMQYKVFRFWESPLFMKLCTTAKTVSENLAAQHLAVDPMICILSYLNSEEALQCRLVCKSWCYGASKDQVWNSRILTQVPGHTGLRAFVRSAALLSSVSVESIRAFIVDNDELSDLILSQIGKAVLHRLDHAAMTPGIFRHTPASGDSKRRRKTFKITSWKYHLGKGDDDLGRISKYVQCEIAFCAHADEFGYEGALVWVSMSGILKYVDTNSVVRCDDNDTTSLKRLMLDYANSKN